ncbi:MAG: redoxin domain-containing protein [bacterium]|nr:redoxin domain-containing protein [bacterium]
MSNSSKIKTIVIIGALLVIAGGFAKERFSRNNSKSAANGNAKNSVSLQSLVDKAAPAFTLTDRQGKPYTNDSLKGKKVVLFFNEGLACYPACWNQMKELSGDGRLNADETVVLSVVMDSRASWQNATLKATELAAINVVFDEGGLASKAFGMISAPSSMHAGTPGHSYVIIDKDGFVRYVLDDPKMAINNGEIYSQLAKIK